MRRCQKAIAIWSHEDVAIFSVNLFSFWKMLMERIFWGIFPRFLNDSFLSRSLGRRFLYFLRAVLFPKRSKPQVKGDNRKKPVFEFFLLIHLLIILNHIFLICVCENLAVGKYSRSNWLNQTKSPDLMNVNLWLNDHNVKRYSFNSFQSSFFFNVQFKRNSQNKIQKTIGLGISHETCQ